MLLKGLAESGPAWASIANNLLPGRTGNQCQQRWEHTLNPDINIKLWETEEASTIPYLIYSVLTKIFSSFTLYSPKLALLEKGVEEHGTSWSKIAPSIQGRTPVQCKTKWNTIKVKTTFILNVTCKLNSSVIFLLTEKCRKCSLLCFERSG
jgi:hypothetical protein